MLLFTQGIPHCGWKACLPLLENAGLKVTASLELPAVSVSGQQPDYRALVTDAVATLSGGDTGQQAQDYVIADDCLAGGLEAVAETVPDAVFILWFSSFEHCLATALTHGVDPEQYARDWEAAVRSFLFLYRKHRRRVVLLGTRSTSVPQLLSEACATLGMPLQQQSVQEAVSIMDDQSEDSFVALMAAHCLLPELPETAELFSELEACALPGQQTENVTDTLEPNMLQQYRRWNETYKDSSIAAQRQRVEHLQEQLNEQTRIASDAKKQLDAITKEVAELAAERDKQAKLATELQTALWERDEHTSRIAALEKQREVTQAEQARLTTELQDKTEENDLLLLQLHQVQEELESLFLQQQQLRQEHEKQATTSAEQTLQLEYHQKTLDATRRELQGAVQDKNQLAFRLEQAKEGIRRLLQVKQQLISATQQQLHEKDVVIQQERRRLNKLKKTASWKITVPLRVMARPFGQAPTEEVQSQVVPQTSAVGELETHAVIVRASGLFDEAWYLTEYLDVTAAGSDPVIHYLAVGAAEGRNPSPEFDTAYYLAANPDVAENGVNPLLHYILIGRAEGRLPLHPQGDDTVECDGPSVEHTHHAACIRESGLFDEAWYCAAYPDVAQQGVDPILHYLRRGAGEGRNPSPSFNTVFYTTNYPDVTESGINPLLHYLLSGKAEGRTPIDPGEAHQRAPEVR